MFEIALPFFSTKPKTKMAALAKSQLLAFEQESGERREDLRRLLNEAVLLSLIHI